MPRTPPSKTRWALRRFADSTAIIKFWQGATDIRWWAAHDVRRVVVTGNEVMLHFVSTMKVPGLATSRMEVYEIQAFNAAGKICSVKAYFDEACLLP